MATRLQFDIDAIDAVCRRRHVRRLAVFGSAVTGEFDPGRSDADFLVEFDETSTTLLEDYFGLKEDLELLLGAPVDLVAPRALDNPYFARSVETSLRELYAAA
ncbi:MAG: nucleotidyltransferase family protein [Ilumatobacter sp.]|uniref:nucleotidyltransferase family protein n=1 Tax=Ilumatobacter sp. TaxID=1967498 RepID=UPI00391BCFF6